MNFTTLTINLKFKSVQCLFLAIFYLTASQARSEESILRLGVHPLHSPQKVHLLFSPICEQISQIQPDLKCILETSKDYADYNEKIKKSHFQILMPNPYQTIKAQTYGYKVISKWGRDDLFKGIILVRKDSKIETLSRLKNSTISFPAPTALAACLMPQYLLFKNGLTENKDYRSRYVGSQESSIFSVLKKDTLAGVTWLQPWQLFKKDHPAEAQELMILAETEQLPNNSVMLHSSLKPEMQIKIQDFFKRFHKNENNQSILDSIGMDKFEPASRLTYVPVEAFLKNFEKDLKKIEW